MAEYLILDLTEEEERILDINNIDYSIDDLFSRDINIRCSKHRFEEILRLIGRSNSYN